MSIATKPLESNVFPVNADGKKIKKQDGTPIASTDDPAVAETLQIGLTTTKPAAKKIIGLLEADPGSTLGGLPQRLGFIQARASRCRALRLSSR